MTEGIIVKMPLEVITIERRYDFAFNKRDLKEFLNLKELDISWTKLRILYLYNICCAMEKQNTFGFLCPKAMPKAHNVVHRMMTYMINHMSDMKLSCYLAPIITSALETYYMLTLGECKPKSSVKWIYPNCYRQPGSTECKYYIIHYMHEIVQIGTTERLQEIFYFLF
ncbi:uncharacterized protein LOC129309139 [Prosopis cineraria]|uniref:uncharacterized protein LOC129309139 n=1 Tax=Prosopis cineraria TaxID=364024 RepID=UPI00240EB972|nr:uncharacterized protein LOC129309139 [Prosopis cineraria]